MVSSRNGVGKLVEVQKVTHTLSLFATIPSTNFPQGPPPFVDSNVKPDNFGIVDEVDEENEDPWENMRVVRSAAFVGSDRRLRVQEVEMLFFRYFKSASKT